MTQKSLRVLDGGSLRDLKRVSFGPSCPPHTHRTAISLSTTICHTVARCTLCDRALQRVVHVLYSPLSLLLHVFILVTMKWSRHCCRCSSDQSDLLTPVLLSGASWFLFSDDAITRILPVTHQARVHPQGVRWVDGFGSRMVRVA